MKNTCLRVSFLTLILVVSPFVRFSSAVPVRSSIMLLSFDPSSEADRLRTLGKQQYLQGLVKEALQSLLAELKIRKSLNNSKNEAITLNNIGLAYNTLGDQNKALDFYGQALSLYQTIHNPNGEATTLYNFGGIYNNLGEKQKALDYYNQALSLYELIKNPEGAADASNDIAGLYFDLGEPQKSLDYYDQALSLYQYLKNSKGEATTLNNFGLVYEFLGEKQKALDYFNQALTKFKLIKDSKGEAATLNNFGILYKSQGDYQKSLDFYSQALSLFNSLHVPNEQATALKNIGDIYSILGENQKALDYFDQARSIFKLVHDQKNEAVTLVGIGGIYSSLGEKLKAIDYYNKALLIFRVVQYPRGEATTLNDIGLVYENLGEHQKALGYFSQALPLYETIQDPKGKATILNNFGIIYEALGEHQKALDYFSQGLTIYRALGDREGESVALQNLGKTSAELNRPQLAIFLLKQSVNTTQSLRKNIKALPKSTQTTYAKVHENSYRILAGYLLDQSRILEAQEVLDLLKVEEITDFFNDNYRGRLINLNLAFIRSEQQLLDQYNSRSQSLVKLGQQFQQLQNLSRSGVKLTPSQEKSKADLDRLLSDAKEQFVSFIDSPEVQASLDSSQAEQQVSLKVFDKLRSNLKKLDNSVLVYPLILDNRLEIIITTPFAPPLRRTVKVSRTELNQAIGAYRNILANPNLDPKPAAFKLYSWLIRPIEEDLKQSNAKTIIYAPDGPLRYVPLAALYDGKEWLAQRYSVNNITSASLTDLSTSSKPSPLRVLAGAFSNPNLSYKILVGNQTLKFHGLPFAGKEVDSLEASIPGTNKRKDEAFSFKTLKPHFGEYNVLHFATHASFFLGQPEDSFILSGSGERVTLRSIESWSLVGIDLVVLSGCETGVGIGASVLVPEPGIKLGSGSEILGLGYQFQESGARATIASLWLVNDGSTQVLMSEFYSLLKKGNISKVEALRQAQVALISGKAVAPAGIKNLNHPHYWGPFFLIGNGF